MKNVPPKYYLWFILLVCFGCQTSRPSLLFSSASQNSNPENFSHASQGFASQPGKAFPVEQEVKTVAKTPEKVLYATTNPQPEPAFFKSRPSLAKSSFPKASSLIKTGKVRRLTLKKIEEEEPGHEHEHRASGIFVGSGMAVLLVSLILLLAGSGAAGLLAIIGGSIFLIGFVLCMAELLVD